MTLLHCFMAVGKSVVILICWSPLKVVFPREFSGSPVVKTLHSLVKTLVWSVVGELRSDKPCSAAKKKLRLKKKKKILSPRGAGGFSGPFSGEAFRVFKLMCLTGAFSTILGPWAGELSSGNPSPAGQRNCHICYFVKPPPPLSHHQILTPLPLSEMLFLNSWWLYVRPNP